MGHIHEKIDFVVGLLVVYNNKVLMVDHKKLNAWVCPGGHIELDEDPEQTLFRELFEETGLKKDDVEVLAQKPEDIREGAHKFLYTPNFLDIHNFNSEHRHIGIMYILRSKTDKVILEKEAHKGIAWIGEAEINSEKYKLTEIMKFYIREAIEKAKL